MLAATPEQLTRTRPYRSNAQGLTSSTHGSQRLHYCCTASVLHIAHVHTNCVVNFLPAFYVPCLLLQLQSSQPTQLSWAHPQYGQLLAVGTSSGKVQLIQGPVPSSSSSQQGQPAQQGQKAWCSTAQLHCGKGAVRWGTQAYLVHMTAACKLLTHALLTSGHPK